MPSNKPLRTNPFLSYRDPSTGQWVTVVPNLAPQPELLIRRPPQAIRIVEPEAFQEMALHRV